MPNKLLPLIKEWEDPLTFAKMSIVLRSQKKKRLAKALKTSIPSDIYQQLWQKLKETKNTVK